MNSQKYPLPLIVFSNGLKAIKTIISDSAEGAINETSLIIALNEKNHSINEDEKRILDFPNEITPYALIDELLSRREIERFHKQEYTCEFYRLVPAA